MAPTLFKTSVEVSVESKTTVGTVEHAVFQNVDSSAHSRVIRGDG